MNSYDGYLESPLDVLHGDELFGLFVAHKPGHPEVPRPYFLHQLVLLHQYCPFSFASCNVLDFNLKSHALSEISTIEI